MARAADTKQMLRIYRLEWNMLRYLGLAVLTVVVVTLAACTGSRESGQQDLPGTVPDNAETTASAMTNSASRTTDMNDTSQTTGEQNGMGDMAVTDDVPRLPPVKAYYEGEEVFFVHPEASDKETADLLTDMMGSPVLVVPELEQVPESSLAKVYVFTNGIKGDGPLGFQPDVFDSAPGDENYSPLRRLYLLTWNNESAAREIKTLQGVRAAVQSGKIELERQDTVINEPFLSWTGGQR
ncbi:hypothetical protein BH23ACT11_BH23ACT11_24780 [soil metagenome]